MKIINARNVCEALPQAIKLLSTEGTIQKSRNGDVYTLPYPVMTIYDRPQEKVLFSSVRDANPFFHLMEAMWMLAGRNDSSFLNHYVKDFGDRFAQQNGVIHGAYGHRWRYALWFDQIQAIINKLRLNPLDRQLVIQMWDCCETPDASNDLLGDWADRPCNSHIYFRVVDGKLDMTTMARSHDALWGATGANAVHFPMLQEYIAGMVGIPVGKFYQFSNNYHLYKDAFDKLLKKSTKGGNSTLLNDLYDQRYSETVIPPVRAWPLITNLSTFDDEFIRSMNYIDAIHNTKEDSDYVDIDDTFKFKNTYDTFKFKNTFLSRTVLTACEAHWIFKNTGVKEALEHSALIEAPDWRIACEEWLQRRVK